MHWVLMCITAELCLQKPRALAGAFARERQRMWVCLFISLGTSPCNLCGGLAPIPMTEPKSQNLQVMSALPPTVSLQQAPPVKNCPLGPVCLGRVSGARTAPSAVLGCISTAKDMLQLHHSKACVVHLCRREISSPWGQEGRRS